MAANIILRTIYWIRAQFLYQAALVFIGVAITIPALVYFLVYDLAEQPIEEPSTCVIHYDYRVPCGFFPGREMGNMSYNQCDKMKCCHDDFTKTCFHYFPAKYGYQEQEGDESIYETKREFTPFGTPMYEFMSLSVTSTNEYIEASLQRDKPNTKSNNVENEILPGIAYNITQGDLKLDIYRTEYPDDKILQTSRGPLIASDGYWEWSVQLTNGNNTMYGLGGLEITGNVTKVIHRNDKDHSNVPFFLAQQQTPNGINYHALLVQHNGLLEVQVLASNLIILRALNTSMQGLSLRFFPGPTLEDIQKQIAHPDTKTEVIPRWLLGTHICRNNVTDLPTMLLEFANEQQFNTLQAESDCFNEMLMILLIELQDDLTLERRNSMRDIVATNLKTKFVLPLTPHIPIGLAATETEPARNYSLFTKALEMDVLLKNQSNHLQTGVYKNRKVAFLDPDKQEAGKYLKLLLDVVDKHIIPVKDIAGVFLFDNWPQDDSYNYTPKAEHLPYYNEEITMALNRTPGMLIMDQDIYVRRLIDRVRDAFNREIPILSASHYYQFHTPLLPQYVNKTWTTMKSITTRTLFANTFTHPVALSPVCGTDAWMNATSHENELCARWFINQATLPGQRMTTNWYTHKNFTLQSQHIVDKALEMKKMLSYYQYTVLRESGHAVKPMFMAFPNDNVTWSLDEQYLLGNLLVVPIFLAQTTMKRFYLPVNVTWFEFWSGANYHNGWQNLSVSKDERFLFLKETSVVPLLKSTSPSDLYFELLIGKSCGIGRESIHGSIFFDTHVLKLKVLDRFIEISNIINVQVDLNCKEVIRNHPHTIRKLKVFDCKDQARVYNINFDICSVNSKDTERVVIRNVPPN